MPQEPGLRIARDRFDQTVVHIGPPPIRGVRASR